MRIGFGYDIHRFAASAGPPLRLGGVAIAHDRGLEGHSDGDVLLHAVADALLGAIAGPDLGELFPSADPANRGADSRIFVSKSLAMVRQAGWAIANLDATVIADTPRVTPHKARIRKAIGKLLGLAPSRVSVKAKTTEGFPPGREGIAAHAVVLLTAVARPKASGGRSRATRSRGTRSAARSRR